MSKTDQYACEECNARGFCGDTCEEPLLPPVQPNREAAARIIDPKPWFMRDLLADEGQTPSRQTLKNIEDSLAKADAILSLTDGKVQRLVEAAQELLDRCVEYGHGELIEDDTDRAVIALNTALSAFGEG